MTEFDWEHQGNARLNQLEGEVADLRCEIADLREYLEELEWEISTPRRERRILAC
jgi:chromosome segregation ATPase